MSRGWPQELGVGESSDSERPSEVSLPRVEPLSEYSFPFEQLPKAGAFKLPLFQAAVLESITDQQVPERMPYYVAAAACSAAAQGLFDVRKPRGGVVGLGVYVMIGARSGERKTTVDRDFFTAFSEMEKEVNERSSESVKEGRAKVKMWKLKGRSLSSRYMHLSETGKDTSEIEKEIKDHEQREPAEGGEKKLVYKDFTIPALKQGFSRMPCLVVLSSDSAKLLNNVILPDDDVFCDVWSNEEINVGRTRQGASYLVEQPRLTTCLALQPKRLKHIMKTNGQEAVESGYFGRVVYVEVGTTMGERVTPIYTTGTERREAFKHAVKSLLYRYVDELEGGDYQRRVLEFSPEAAHVWLKYLDYVERQERAGGRYFKATEHACKLADNVARFAAGFHVVEGFDGNIGSDCVLAAIALCNEASYHYVEHIAPKDQDEEDAMLLYDWLKKRNEGRSYPGARVAKFYDMKLISNMMRFCPARLRGVRIHHLLGILEHKGLVAIEHWQTSRGRCSAIVNMYPANNRAMS